MWPCRRGAGRGGGRAGEGTTRLAARLPAIMALVRESRGRVVALLLEWLASIVVEVRVMGRGRWEAVGLFRSACIEDVRRMLGLGGEGARFEAGIRDRFSTLADGPSRPLVGVLGRGERVEDADTKVSSDEAELADVRLNVAGAAGCGRSVLDCIGPDCSSEVEAADAFGSCAGGLSDGFVTALKLSTVALGRSPAGGCRLGFGPSLRGSGERISVAARRMICGGVDERSGTGRGFGLGAGRVTLDGVSAGLPSLSTSLCS